MSLDSTAESSVVEAAHSELIEDLTPVVEVERVTISDIVNARRIINGPSDKLRAVSASRYPWARPLWHKMRGNRWEIDQITMVRDKLEFTQLSPAQQMAAKRSLAFLSNLDAIQTENLSANIAVIITDPSISQLIARQQFEEWIHVEMYSSITETLFGDPLEIYDMYRNTPILKNKNDFIIAQGGQVTLDPTPQNKIKALVNNLALEGIYFFSGFLTFYTINRSTGKLNGVVDGIKYIQRDELTHLEIFQNCFNTLRMESPEYFTPQFLEECREILRVAATYEKAWGRHVIGAGIPGVNAEISDGFIEHRADECSMSLGLGPLYGKPNPAPWFYAWADVNTQGNFFESKPLTYNENKPTFSRRRAAPVAPTIPAIMRD